eukprot:NODE_267_length_11298_cov_1.167872.p2 type:complete len:509 gc:universal NODE_267_length_11298_cov_1.167872:675-2201(+)
MLMLVGTETNTALQFAQQIQFRLQRYGHSSRLLLADDVDVIRDCSFVVSTYGQGEMPKTIKKLWARLMKKDAPRVNATIFIYGVGDSFYTHYNYAAKKLYRRLIQLGAKAKLVLGDLQDGYASTLKEFSDLIIGTLPVGEFQSIMYKYDLSAGDAVETLEFTNYEQLCVQENKRLTPEDHFQETRHIEFSTNLENVPGDVLNIIPEALNDEVDEVLRLTNWDKDVIWQIRNGYEQCPSNLQKAFSIFCILKYIVDIHALPGPSFFYTLYTSCQELQIERKEEILSRLLALSEFDPMYTLYVSKPKRTCVEVLSDFQDIAKHLDSRHIFDLFPLHQPRQFSIASCKEGQFDLCVALVKYRSIMKLERRGLCTHFLKSLKIGQKVWCKLEKHPLRTKYPLLMIATGTGIAVPRAILHYHQKLHEIDNLDKNLLIFGCRYPDKDNYYKDEFESCIDYRPVYSRVDKIYVQDKFNSILPRLENYKNIIITGSKNLQDFQDIIKVKGVQYEIW